MAEDAGAAPAADPAAAAPGNIVADAAAPPASAPAAGTPPGNIVADAGIAPAADAPPSVADQRTFLLGKTPDLKLEGKTDAEITALYDAAKKAEAAPPTITAEDARKYLTEKGGKAEDVAKLSDEEAVKQAEKAKADEANKPIEYTAFTLPKDVTLDEATLKDFTALAASKKMSQEEAQGLIDLHVKQLQDVAKAPYKLWSDTQAKWQQEVKADPELGGANYDTKTRPAIAEFIRVFGGDEAGQKALREAMSFTGAGNNPAVVRALARAGAILQEGKTIAGGKPAPKPNDPASTLYPNQGKATT